MKSFLQISLILFLLSPASVSLFDSHLLSQSVLSICFLHDLSACLTMRGCSCHGDNNSTVSINEIELTSLHAGSHPSRWQTPEISSFSSCLLQITVCVPGSCCLNNSNYILQGWILCCDWTVLSLVMLGGNVAVLLWKWLKQMKTLWKFSFSSKIPLWQYWKVQASGRGFLEVKYLLPDLKFLH